jgi:hydrocephalus-inducing protein
MSVTQTVLVMTNNSQEDLGINCLYVSNDICQVQFNTTFLAPKAKIEVPISITPNSANNFKETIVFSINGCNNISVEVTATGVPLKLQLERSFMKIVNMGAASIGQVIKRTVNVSNPAPLPVPFKLIWDDALLQQHALSIVPTDVVTIPPKSTVPVTITFAPPARLVHFIDEVSIEYHGQSHQLLSIEGSCQGILVELGHEELHFGTVVVGNSVKRKLLMSNVGDIGTKFSWDFAPAKDIFDISPVQGYLPPGSDIALTVTFTPKKIAQDIRFEQLRCTIEGGKMLYLSLSGNASMQQVEREVVQFMTPVRQAEVKQVKLVNTSSTDTWNLRPVFDNECFRGPAMVKIPAGQSIHYDISFLPLTMTQPVVKDKKVEDSRPHMGSLFIPCPDGSALVFNLIGSALPPKPAAVLTREVPSKLWYTESLPVTNWLKKPQRFHVLFNKTKAEPSTTFKVCVDLSVLVSYSPLCRDKSISMCLLWALWSTR